MRYTYPCPGCGQDTLHRSRCRTFSENMIHRLTLLRICRCTHCNWRGAISLFRLDARKMLLRLSMITGLLIGSGWVVAELLGI